MKVGTLRKTWIRSAGLAVLLAPGFLFAQPSPDAQTESPTTKGGWRRVEDAPPAPAGVPRDQFGEPVRGDRRLTDSPAPQMEIPPQLTLKKGSFLTVRVDQPLSSDRNQQGDPFSATLARPVVVDGVVVAERGQTLSGRVEAAEKAGRVRGTSKLALQLTDLSLVDGQQVPIQTQLIGRSGATSEGRDAGAIASTTAMGAMIGTAADWGRGAAIGAGAGAAAGIVGVLLTRGHPTVVYPETILTFRIEAPVTISTERAAQAFRWVDRDDYDRPQELERRPTLVRRGCGPYGCPPTAPYYYGASVYPYYHYGPSIGWYFGPRFYHGGGFYFGRGHGRGHRR